MIKELLVSGTICSAIACQISYPVMVVDTLSPGVVEYYDKNANYINQINSPVKIPRDTSYQADLITDFESNWKQGASIYLVEVLNTKSFLTGDDSTELVEVTSSNPDFWEISYRSREFSWRGELIEEEEFDLLVKNENKMHSCYFVAPNVTTKSNVYFNEDFKKESIYKHSYGFTTFMENGEIRIENKNIVNYRNSNINPYVSLSLDSSFALHRGEISPLNSSSIIGNTHYLGYDSKGVLLGQFTQEEKKAFELESPVEKVFFKRMNQYKGWSKYD